MECGGYAARIYSHYRPFVVSAFVAQYFLIVVVSAPQLTLSRALIVGAGLVLSSNLPKLDPGCESHPYRRKLASAETEKGLNLCAPYFSGLSHHR